MILPIQVFHGKLLLLVEFRVDPEDGSSMYLRNIGNIDRVHTL
jgi:hypothetical protein